MRSTWRFFSLRGFFRRMRNCHTLSLRINAKYRMRPSPVRLRAIYLARRLARHSHGGTGSPSARSPRLAALALRSAASSAAVWS